MKKKMLIISGSVLILLILLVLFMSSSTYKNEHLDRFNPLLKRKTGYAILPATVTYNNGKNYSENKAKSGEGFQIPDDYHVLVVDSPSENDKHTLTFSGGQSPEGKNHAKVTHKGSYVYKIEFISWDKIPKKIKQSLVESNGN